MYEHFGHPYLLCEDASKKVHVCKLTASLLYTSNPSINGTSKSEMYDNSKHCLLASGPFPTRTTTTRAPVVTTSKDLCPDISRWDTNKLNGDYWYLPSRTCTPFSCFCSVLYYCQIVILPCFGPISISILVKNGDFTWFRRNPLKRCENATKNTGGQSAPR